MKYRRYPSVSVWPGLKRGFQCVDVHAEIAAVLEEDQSGAVADDSVSGGQDAEGWPKDSAEGIVLRLPLFSACEGSLKERKQKASVKHYRWKVGVYC